MIKKKNDSDVRLDMYFQTRTIYSCVGMCTAQSTVLFHAVEPHSRQIVSDEMLMYGCQPSTRHEGF